MVFTNLEDAVDELRRHPSQPVRAHVRDLDLEVRVLEEVARPARLGDFLAALGPWEGESHEELMAILRQARAVGGSAEPPEL